MTYRDSVKDALVSTGCPVVREEKIAFGRLVGLDDFLNDEYMVVRFERDVVWIRESTTQTKVILDGDEEISDYSPHHDYYGFLTSLRDPLETARAYTRKKRIGSDDIREVRTTVSIFETPRLRAPARLLERSSRRVDHSYLSIPQSWCLDNESLARRAALWSEPYPRSEDYHERNFADDVEMSRLEPVPVADVIIFSSRWTDEENFAAIQSLKAYVPEGMNATLEGIDLHSKEDVDA